MTQECITYVCLRPEHHRHRTPGPAFTTYKECCAFCPANTPEGHVWSLVPEVTFKTLEALGWVPGRRHSPDHAETAVNERELAGTVN